MVVLNPGDYTAMGQSHSNLTEPDNYLPAYCRQKFPYAAAKDSKFIVYNFYNGSATVLACANYTFTGTEWVKNDGIVTQTSQFVRSNGTWKFDPSVTVNLPPVSYTHLDVYKRQAYKLGNDIKDSMNHYFRGQALIACIVAVIYCVGFSLCKLPLSIVLGLGTSVLFMIPYCQYLSIIPVTLLCLVGAADGKVDFWAQWWECMAVFLTVQVVADLILTPRIMGKAMGLNPAIILLSLSIWGSLFGLIGMIIALPLTTLLLSYYEQYIIMRNNDEPPSVRRKEVQEIKDMAEISYDRSNDLKKD